jgi:hypothetical protein
MMPMLECLCDIQVHASLSDLNKFSGELSVIAEALSDSLEAGSHELAVPLLSKLGRSFSHVDGNLRPLEPLSH